MSRFEALAYVVIRVSSAFIFQTFAEVCYSVFVKRSPFKSRCWIFVKLTYLRVCWRSTIDLCLMNLPKRSPSCVARRPLFHKVNLPRCEARRHHFIMTCDIFGTGQTNILALCYLFGKTWPAHSSATQATEINTLDQITGKVIDVSRTHIPLKVSMIPWNVWNWEV